MVKENVLNAFKAQWRRSTPQDVLGFILIITTISKPATDSCLILKTLTFVTNVCLDCVDQLRRYLLRKQKFSREIPAQRVSQQRADTRVLPPVGKRRNNHRHHHGMKITDIYRAVV